MSTSTDQSKSSAGASGEQLTGEISPHSGNPPKANGGAEKLAISATSTSQSSCTKDCKPGFPNTCPNRGHTGDNFTCVQVHSLLRGMGINDPEKRSRCVKAGIQNKSISVTGNPSDLDKVLGTGRADGSDDCRHKLKATLSQLLQQPDLGADSYGIDYDNATVVCQKKDCEGTTFVTHMCSGNFHFDNGKAHNHCKKCPGFGQCIDNFKMKHCSSCGTHYFAGRFGQMKCCTGPFKAKEESSPSEGNTESVPCCYDESDSDCSEETNSSNSDNF